MTIRTRILIPVLIITSVSAVLVLVFNIMHLSNHIKDDTSIWPYETMVLLFLSILLLILIPIIIVFSRNIALSEKKKIEQDLEDALKVAEDALKAKSAFLTNMSHEIRTPLNGIIGFAELALDDDNISDKTEDYISKINDCADGLLDIINDVLDLSKIESGKIELEEIPFELDSILNTCKSIIEPKVIEKGIALYFYSEPLAGKKLIGDPTKLRQILLNLLSNAVKFTHNGMIKVTTAIEKEVADTLTMRFEVKDSGIGMNEKQIKHIFDPFVQANVSTTRKYGGTGLGLTLTKNFVEMMGGSLWVESSPDSGCTFDFTLPFDTISETKEDHPRKNLQTVVKKPVFSGKVLVCEDNRINQDVITNHLIRVGLTPTIAVNGKHGLEFVQEHMSNDDPFDLIIMDIHMPVMDGLEAAHRLAEIGNKSPIIALTANATDSDREKYLQQGMSDYLSKPFNSRELWACLLRHLEPISSNEQYDTEHAANAALKESKEIPLNISSSAGILLTENNVLNEALGIERTSNDIKLYRHIQKNFVKDYRHIIDHLNNMIESDDLKSVHRSAHTLKDTALTIGAEKLATAAYAIESDLSRGNTDNLNKQIMMLDVALHELLNILKPIAEAYVSEKDTGIPHMLDTDQAISLINELIPFLEAGYQESMNFIDRIRNILSPLGEVCDDLLAQIEDYEFDVAYETLLGIKALLLDQT